MSTFAWLGGLAVREMSRGFLPTYITTPVSTPKTTHTHTHATQKPNKQGLLVVQATYGDGASKYELSSSPPMLLPLLAFGMDDRYACVRVGSVCKHTYICIHVCVYVYN